MERWLACAVLAAFILGDPAGAEETTGRDRFWVDAAALKWKIGDAPQPTALVTAGSLAAPLPAKNLAHELSMRCPLRSCLMTDSNSVGGSA